MGHIGYGKGLMVSSTSYDSSSDSNNVAVSVRAVTGNRRRRSSNTTTTTTRRRRRQRVQQQRNRADLLAGPGFSVQRGPRMPRARRTKLDCLAVPTSHVRPLSTPREIDLSKIVYLFRKQLRNSDVGCLRRTVLPKKEAELNLPMLDTKDGIVVGMLDMDGIHEWWFRYRYWPNNSSRMYVLEYTGDFVYTHGLKTDDYMLLYRNIENGQFIIEARKKEHSDVPRTYNNFVLINELIKELAIPELPAVIDLVMHDNNEMLYGCDNTILNDAPLEYVGEAIKLPSLGSDSSFEDYNIEDIDFD